MSAATDSLSYMIGTLGWSLLGFVVGLVVGRASRDVHRIASKAGETTVDERTNKPGRNWAQRLSGQFVLGVIVVLLGIITVLQGIVADRATTRLQQCQASYANRFADALDARTTASNDSQQAMDRLVRTIGAHVSGSPGDQVAIRDSIRQYTAQRQRSVKARTQHPYPAPPREACNE